MNNVYFVLNNVKYVFIYENESLNIFKEVDSQIVNLNSEEEEDIKKILDSKRNYIYNTDLLVELINKNDQIENKQYIYNFLSWLENVIPLDYRNNFYNNIKTLKTDLKLDYEFSSNNILEHNKYGSTASYNVKENTLIMDAKTLEGLWRIAKTTKNPKDFYWKEYSQILLHELCHMASSKYDEKTAVALCGFDKYPTEIEKEKNRGLTEGFTESLSMAGVVDTIEFSSGYYIEACLVNQLMQLVGYNTLAKSYFGNMGTSLIEEVLQDIGYDKEKAEKLFRNIELNYNLGHFDGKQNVLGSIQLSLLDYLDKKCELLYEKNDIPGLNNTLSLYEQMIVTPDKLKLMLKNPDNYDLLTDSLLKLECIKSKYRVDTNDKEDVFLK